MIVSFGFKWKRKLGWSNYLFEDFHTIPKICEVSKDTVIDLLDSTTPRRREIPHLCHSRQFSSYFYVSWYYKKKMKNKLTKDSTKISSRFMATFPPVVLRLEIACSVYIVTLINKIGKLMNSEWCNIYELEGRMIQDGGMRSVSLLLQITLFDAVIVLQIPGTIYSWYDI